MIGLILLYNGRFKVIDIHSHTLFGIDDSARCDESIRMVHAAAKEYKVICYSSFP